MDNLSLLSLHLIRPYWLLALVPLVLCLWIYSRNQKLSGKWSSVIDPRLLPHLIHLETTRQKTASLSLLFILGSLVIFALAGPAFEKRPQPVYRAQSALVILLDLSRSMDAEDIKPSRLSRARFKIEDILKQRNEGQTALIVYAADAFVVSPLTDDARTISAQVPALQTGIMPAQGSRLDIALQKAHELFINAGHRHGQIIIISDSIDAAAVSRIETLKQQHYKTSVLAIGTEAGAPVSTGQGGFIKDSLGEIVIPKLDIQSMQQATRAGGGRFSLLSADDRDINTLLGDLQIERVQNQSAEASADGSPIKTDTWYESGPWLLLFVIPFAAYAFRRGLVFVLVVFILPLPHSDALADALDVGSFWKNTDQRATTLLEQGDSQKAAELFTNPEWKAAAQYRAGQYQQAAEQLKAIDTADAQYNRGNALAKSGDLQQALAAYQRALELQPQHDDAKYNLELVKKALQEQQQNASSNESTDDSASSKDDSQSSGQQDKQGGEPGSSQQDANSQPGSETDAEQQGSGSPQKTESESKEGEASAQSQGNDQSHADEKKDSGTDAGQQQAQSADAGKDNDDGKPGQSSAATPSEEDSPDLDQQQVQQWLKKIPDDPGGLLRRKFKYQYGRQATQPEAEPW